MLRLKGASRRAAHAAGDDTGMRREAMVVTIVGKRVFVRLSRRNLRQLNTVLDGRDARRTCLARRDHNGVSIVLQVEEDADHYEERDRLPA